MLCVYGLQSLMTASNELLRDRYIRGKFICIQVSVLCNILPGAICQGVGIDASYGKNQVYTKDVMTDAWSAFITVICMALLSFAFVRFFNHDDCMCALKGTIQGNEKFAKSMHKIKHKYSIFAKNDNYSTQQAESDTHKNDTEQAFASFGATKPIADAGNHDDINCKDDENMDQVSVLSSSTNSKQPKENFHSNAHESLLQ